MKVTLKNDLLTVVIDSHGAELQNITNNRTGQEYLWQGDPTFWGRRSPILFPIVGAVWQKVYRMDGKEFSLGQHGFARDCEFVIMDDAPENEAWFALDWSDGTLEHYPFRFRLEVRYSLVGERLTVDWVVSNSDTREILFQIGAHPAFNYPEFSASDPVHGYFDLGVRNVSSQVIESGGCVGECVKEVSAGDDGLFALTGQTFADDALILADGQTGRVSMLDKHRRPYLTLLFRAPVVGLWSPVAGNAPFVCIEPWWGRCDRVGFAGEFSEKEYVECLGVGQTFRAGYMIIIDNL